MKGQAMRFFCACVCMFFMATVLVAAEESPEGKTVSSVLIQVQGDTKAQPSNFVNLEKSLKTKEQHPFSNADFDEDLKLLLKEFDDVDPQIKVDGNRAQVIFAVKKQPVIHSLTYVGNKAFDVPTLQKQLSISQGALLNRSTFNSAIQKLRSYYLKKGYFEVDVQYEIKPIPSERVDVIIKINEGRAGFVADIRLNNFTEKEEKEIKEILMTQTYSWWHSWLTDQGTFYQDVFRHDELTILSYLHNEGYLDAVIDTKIVPSLKKDRIDVEISVEKGPVYHLGTVRISGNTLFPEETLLQKLAWKEGDVFSQEKMREKTRDLYVLYGSKGYIDAAINPECSLRDKELVYDLHFSIEEKLQSRVGLIHISGNKVTDASVILHESLLVPGDILNVTYLSKTEERLKNTGYFKSVNVYALKATELKSSSTTPFRDIHIEVEEMPTTANFTAFVGYSTTQSVSGGVGFSETNFKLKGITDVFSDGYSAVRGGGESLNLNLTVGTKQSSETLSWVKPYIFDTPWIFSVDLMNESNSYSFDEYTIKSKSAVFTGRYPLNPFVKYDLYYRIRNAHNDLHNIKHDRHSAELRRESKIDGTISAVGTGLEYDSTNHPYSPTEGTRSNATAEYAGLFGDHHFAAFHYLNTLFWKPGEKGIFKFRGNLDFMQTLFQTKPSHVPLDERLYLGGEMSVRGYQFNTVGPHFHDKNYTPRGGMSSLLFSGEYAYPLWKRLDAFVFCDAGNVYWKEWSLGILRYSVGFGIKFYIAEHAPLTIGLGFPINPASKRDVQQFFLSIGANF